MACVEVHWLCPEEYADVGVEVASSGNLLLACIKALCISRVGEIEEAQSWFLET